MKTYFARIATLSDGNRTVAELDMSTAGAIIEHVTEGRGSAGREPGDKHNSEIGEKLALARALRSAAAHLERQALGRMRHIESNRQHRAEIAAVKRLKATASWAMRSNSHGDVFIDHDASGGIV